MVWVSNKGTYTENGFIPKPRERCPYCQAEEPMGGKDLVDWDGSAINILVDGSLLYTYCDCGRHAATSIRYCPMCGREL